MYGIIAGRRVVEIGIMSSKERGARRGARRRARRDAGKGARGRGGAQARPIKDPRVDARPVEDLGVDARVAIDSRVDGIIRALEEIGTLLGK